MMIAYKYKLYNSKNNKYIKAMLTEACFVWNHALSIQKRYYRLYHRYVSIGEMKHHFAKRIKRIFLPSHTCQEILERLDMSYKRFFKRITNRPPKFKNKRGLKSIVFKGVGGYSLNGNVLTINRFNKRFRFSLSRPYSGKVKLLVIKSNNIGELFISIVVDKSNVETGKTHNGASVGIDFGLKTYLTLSDGSKYENPLFMKESLAELRKRSSNLSKCKKGSNNKKRKRKELDRLWNNITNKRDDFQWKLAHDLCRKYDNIFIEDLNLSEMKLSRKANRKLKDQAHADFVIKLQHIAKKYGVVIHKIDRYYPSSRTCTCGYINNNLKLTDRNWICPVCGTKHERDFLAANNILRRGIVELNSVNKTYTKNVGACRHVSIQQSHKSMGVCQ